MYIASETEEVIGNSNGSKAFTIAASSKAFKILSSNIYKNKIRAVVRELICNAVDAHILNDQKEPYSVKAPNELDPRFIVRDFGPGLSHEDMIELYTTYFASTKADRNDQIGALGLGSKSPFSYTSTFSVVSYFDGVVRVYQCMLSNGEPSIVKTHEEPFKDGDKTGIEVIVPVKVADLPRWATEICYVLRPFKYGSFVLKGTQNTPNSFDTLPEYSNDWFGLNKTPFEQGIFAIYGNIVYPLNDVPGIQAKWLKNKYSSVFVHFKLGELDIQPSREELSLDEVTVENLIKRIDAINLNTQTEDIEYLQHIENPRELARELINLKSSAVDILENSKILIQGKLPREWFAGINGLENKIENMKACRLYEYSGGSVLSRKLICRKNSYRRVKISEVDAANVFSYKNKKVFVMIDDTKKQMRNTILGWWLDGKTNPLSPSRNDEIFVALAECPTQMKAIEDMKKLMHGDEVIVMRSSEMEHYRKLVPNYGVKKPTQAQIRPKAANGYKYKLSAGMSHYSSEELFMNAEEIDNLSGLVVGINRDNVTIFGDDFNMVHGLTWNEFKTLCILSGINEFTAIRPSIQDRVAKNPNLECAFKHTLNVYKKLVINVKVDDYAHEANDRFYLNIKTLIVKYGLEASHFIHSTDPNALKLNKYHAIFNKVYLSKTTNVANIIKFIVGRCSKNKLYCANLYKAKYKEFRSKFVAQCKYLESTYSIEPSDGKSVADQLNILFKII